MTYRNKTALITGASMGIGAVFAHRLAAQGADVVLVARSQSKLDALAQELTSTHNVKAHVVAADLTRPGAIANVKQAVATLNIDLLVNNAGFATHGRFEETPIARQLEEISLNVSALVEMTHAFLPQLLERRGAIINVASTASFQPLPMMAVYGASKAFVLSFSEALWAEYKDRGVKVLALCPGATDTPFFQVAGEAAAVGKKADPVDVVNLGLEALARGRSSVIHGTGNYLMANLNRFVPRSTTLAVTRSVMMKNQPKLSA